MWNQRRESEIERQLQEREQLYRTNAVREGVDVDGAVLVTSSAITYPDATTSAAASRRRLVFWVIWPDRLEIHDVGVGGFLSSTRKSTETVHWRHITRLSVTGRDWKTLQVHTIFNPFKPFELFQFPQEVARVKDLLERLSR